MDQIAIEEKYAVFGMITPDSATLNLNAGAHK